MIVRSITLGIDQHAADVSSLKEEISNFFVKAENLFFEQQIEVRTQRIGLAPFRVAVKNQGAAVLSTTEAVASLSRGIGIRWFDVPFHTAGADYEASNEVALDVMKTHENAFVNFMVTDGSRVDTQAVDYAAEHVREVSKLSSNGFDNFRFGTSFNTKPHGAFFPFMHHQGKNGFSIALELIHPIVEVIERSQSKAVESLRSAILDELVGILSKIDEVARSVEEQTAMRYLGIDASLAPHPERSESSIGHLFRSLGVQCFGNSGTAFIASFLTDIVKSAVKRSGIKATGFNGVMYSVLEDSGLGLVSEDANGLPKSQLLALSAICGCGVDMLPVPGDIGKNEIGSIMLDVGAMAIWLNKPLGVRLLPIPGKVAGDVTDFQHDFFINTRIQATRAHQGFGTGFGNAQPFGYLRDDGPRAPSGIRVVAA